MTERDQNTVAVHSKPGPSLPLLVTIAAGLALVGFLLGYVPMRAKVSQKADRVETLERQQLVLELQTMLASSAIDARHGRYEPARQQTSQFYTALADELKNQDASAFLPAQRENVSPLLTQRDELITLLARNDPASADRLANLYVEYRRAVGHAVEDAMGGSD